MPGFYLTKKEALTGKIQTTCPECFGTGISEENYCLYCDGEGVVDEEE